MVSDCTYPTMKIKGKDYLEVKYRIVWFRKDHPDWSIETEIHYIETVASGAAIIKAYVKDDKFRILSTGFGHETKQNFPEGWVEKAETAAIGRAIAHLGYGTLNALELEEGQRIVDAPVGEVDNVEQDHQREYPPIPPTDGSGSPYSLDDPGKVMVPFGRDKGKRINELSRMAIENDIKYWSERIAKEGKPSSGKLTEYMTALQAYVTVLDDPRNQEDIPF